MTLCVGAISDRSYFCVSDQLLSNDYMAAESRYVKTGPIASRWLLSYSGSARNYVGLMNRLNLRAEEDATFKTVLEAVIEAYDDERRDDIGGLLKKYNTTWDQLNKRGRKSFGDQKFVEIYQEIAERWSLSLLVGGFDENGYDRLFSIDDNGLDHLKVPGYGAIGIGAHAALGVLYRTYNDAESDEALAALLLDAKFISEVSPFIGSKTILWKATPTEYPRTLGEDYIDEIREEWERSSKDFITLASARIPRDWTL